MDLLERLRGLDGSHPPFGAAHEAADEIERLRRRLQDGSPVVEGTIQHMAMEIAALKRERDELVEVVKQWVKCCELSKTIRTEIAIPLHALEKLGADKMGDGS